MPATKVFHLGILVNDLEAARALLSGLLGVTWDEIREASVDVTTTAGTERSEVRLCFSVEGPPFVELVQAQDGGGVYSRSHGEGLHHVALWEEDLDARLEELAAEGVNPECVVGWPGDPTMLAAYLPPAVGGGTRVELIRRLPEMPGYMPNLPGA
jgi:catechol 2,3-dioxygenase-like lactoylglutathione lyase family enzyme